MNLLKKISQNYSKTFLLPISLALLLVGAFFWKVVIKGYIPVPGDFVVGVYYPWLDYKWGFPAGVPVKNPITTDVPSFTFPMQTFAVNLMRSGHLPLWNPLILTGSPLLANFQSAPFAPTEFVYFIFDILTAWSVQIILQHVLAIVFTYILLRHWKASRVASLFGGLVFAFSGFNLIWSQWNGHTLAAAFIPLILLFEDKFLRDAKYIYGIGFSVSLALQMLSGYPQVVLYTGVAIGLLLLIRIWEDPKKIKKTFWLFIFGVLAIGLSAFQILPGKELLSLSQREVEPHPFEWAFLPWVKTITFLAPDFFGNHATKNFWGPQDYTSTTGFVGVAAFSLAALSLNKLREKKFILLLAIVALLLSFPTPVSIFFWKSGFLGLQAASAHRALVLWNLAVALGAGFGIDYLFRVNKPKLNLYFFLPYLIVGGFTLVALYLFVTTRSDPSLAIIRGIPKYTVALRNLILPIGFLAGTTFLVLLIIKVKKFKKPGVYLLFLLAVIELFKFGWKFTPIVPRNLVFPETPILSFLINQEKPFRTTGSRVIPINMRMPYGIETVEGYDAVYPLEISRLLASVNSGKVVTNPLGRYATVDGDTSPILDLLNTKYYITLRYNKKGDPSPDGEIPTRFRDDRFKVVMEDKSSVVLESKTVLPRAFMVYDWQKVSEADAIDLLINDKFDYSKAVLLSDNAPQMEKTFPNSQNFVSYKKYSADESVIDVDTDSDGLLFISDAYYPGWKAYVDNEETPILKADFAFRAIEVPKGKHVVKMLYLPNSFYDGINISAASLFILIALYLLRKKLYLT